MEVIVVEHVNFKELTGAQLGQMQNHLGLLTQDSKGHRSLNSEKFLQLTKLTNVQAEQYTGKPRQAFYKDSIPLKPSYKLTERVIALVTATDIAYELFAGVVEDTVNWMMAPNALLFGASPFEVCMRGDAKPLIEWLLDRAGQKTIGLQQG